MPSKLWQHHENGAYIHNSSNFHDDKCNNSWTETKQCIGNKLTIQMNSVLGEKWTWSKCHLSLQSCQFIYLRSGHYRTSRFSCCWCVCRDCRGCSCWLKKLLFQLTSLQFFKFSFQFVLKAKQLRMVHIKCIVFYDSTTLPRHYR